MQYRWFDRVQFEIEGKIRRNGLQPVDVGPDINEPFVEKHARAVARLTDSRQAQGTAGEGFRKNMPLAGNVGYRRMTDIYVLAAPSGGRIRPGVLCFGRMDPASKDGHLKTEAALPGGLKVAGIVPPLGAKSGMCTVILGKV